MISSRADTMRTQQGSDAPYIADFVAEEGAKLRGQQEGGDGVAVQHQGCDCRKLPKPQACSQHGFNIDAQKQNQ